MPEWIQFYTILIEQFVLKFALDIYTLNTKKADRKDIIISSVGFVWSDKLRKEESKLFSSVFSLQ